MGIFDKILNYISGAEVSSAAYKPTTPYTGALPKGTVKKGTKGADTKAVQTFLNWCIKAGLAVDGSCGPKTVAAIKKYQKQYAKQYGLAVDGVFGPASKKAAQAIINKYKPAPTTQTWVDKANAWAKKIADSKYHYVLWKPKIEATHTCPICTGRKYNNYYGWNCIGFAFAVWHHGGGLKSKCNCGVVANEQWEKMLNSTTANALALAKKCVGLNDLAVIINKNGIPKSQWKAGDICGLFKGSKYVHTYYYMGNGKIAESTGSSGKVPVNDQIRIKDYKNYSAKIIIRYTGK